VKRQQLFLTGGGLLLLTVLYFFGHTVPPKKNNLTAREENAVPGNEKPIDIQDILKASSSRLSPVQVSRLNRLENSVGRGDVKNQQLRAYQLLAGFWKDSVQDAFLPAAYYTGEAAKLENSEKSLTFAAQLFLVNLRGQDNPALKSWMARQAKELFERALQVNPKNDSAKIGLGATYIFGSTSSPQEVMQGIQQILAVVHQDSTNMYAQFILGLGGIESGQFDKAIERLTRVVQHQPGNIEAMLTLAEAYQRKGDKPNAVKWYIASKNLIVNPEVNKEIDKRIKLLQ
jgi:tetratricopeptide (TPR) repeat protein